MTVPPKKIKYYKYSYAWDKAQAVIRNETLYYFGYSLCIIKDYTAKDSPKGYEPYKEGFVYNVLDNKTEVLLPEDVSNEIQDKIDRMFKNLTKSMTNDKDYLQYTEGLHREIVKNRNKISQNYIDRTNTSVALRTINNKELW